MDVPLGLLNSTNTTGLLNFTQTYAQSLPNLVISGDIFSILVASLLFFVAVFLINKVSGFLWYLLRKTMLLFITGLAVYYFGIEFFTRLTTLGITVETIIFGVIGLAVGIFGIYMSIRSWFTGAKESYHNIKTKDEGKAKDEKDSGLINEIKSFKDEFSLQFTKHDNNLLSILVYLIIGQFGIFSSPTIAPPNPSLGLVLFGLFILGAIFFVRQTYKHFNRGLAHLVIALVIGFLLSLLLGYFWASIPIGTLFSYQYFGTNCVVALITGMAVSLIMGKK